MHSSTLAQTRWSKAFDAWMGPACQTNGSWDFPEKMVPAYLRPGMVVYDIGSGKRPAISAAEKARLGLSVFGMDIEAGELDHAPESCYDAAIVADICQYRGSADADLVVAKTVIEHVPDTAAAFRSIASMLKPGGMALLFVPCRYALFARINLLLPQRLKLALLRRLRPGSADHIGFPAHYDRCTPRQFRKLAAVNGLEVIEQRLYFHNGYLHSIFPLHVGWRLWNSFLRWCNRAAACQSFATVLRAPLTATPPLPTPLKPWR